MLTKPSTTLPMRKRSDHSSCKLVPSVTAVSVLLFLAIQAWYAWQGNIFASDVSTVALTNKQKAPVALANKQKTLVAGCDPLFAAVEIGTSNFDTIIQAKAKTDPNATGLSVDAMQPYINQLPNMKCWTKLARAVVGKTQDVPPSGELPTFFVDQQDIVKYNLHDFLRGCNSVGRPHPTAAKNLADRNMLHLLRNISVPVQSVEQLLENNNVCRMQDFKVDVEGMDGELLIGFAEWVASHNNKCYAETVTGEFNNLSNGRVGREDANQALMKVGYKIEQTRGVNTIWKYAGAIYP